MNREQRRAQLKNLGKKFNGFDITTGVLKIPVCRGSEEMLEFNLYDFDSLYNIVVMADNFQNINENHAEDFARIDAMTNESKKTLELFKVFRAVIQDFVTSVDGIFGEGSALKVFKMKTPSVQLVSEFLEDLAPLIQVAVSMISEDVGNIDSVGSIKSSNVTNFSADRLGNI